MWVAMTLALLEDAARPLHLLALLPKRGGRFARRGNAASLNNTPKHDWGTTHPTRRI